MSSQKYKSYHFKKNKTKIIMEAQGKVIAILEVCSGVSKAGREWMSQEYVIETPGQYPKRICFNLFGADRINEAHIQMGEDIIIEFDIDAREWQGRWFNSIRAWKVERAGAQQPAPMDGAPFPPPSAAPVDFAAGDEKDDLPF